MTDGEATGENSGGDGEHCLVSSNHRLLPGVYVYENGGLMEIKDFYTQREMIAILAIGSTTLERWTRTGEVRSFKKGQRRLYPKSEIRRLLGPRTWEREIVNTPEVAVKVQKRRSSYPVRGRRGE